VVELSGPVSTKPTASQIVCEGQDTLSKLLDFDLAGATARCTDHVDPFQRTASGNLERDLPDPRLYEPTATHAVADGHETPFRSLNLAPRGVGTG
jgi:hypothetical protein